MGPDASSVVGTRRLRAAPSPAGLVCRTRLRSILPKQVAVFQPRSRPGKLASGAGTVRRLCTCLAAALRVRFRSYLLDSETALWDKRGGSLPAMKLEPLRENSLNSFSPVPQNKLCVARLGTASEGFPLPNCTLNSDVPLIILPPNTHKPLPPSWAERPFHKCPYLTCKSLTLFALRITPALTVSDPKQPFRGAADADDQLLVVEVGRKTVLLHQLRPSPCVVCRFQRGG